MTRSFVQMGLVALALSGCMAGAHNATVPDAEHATMVVDEATESALLDANGGRSKLVVLHQADDAERTLVTVHGMNGSPDEMQPLHDSAAQRGSDVLTFIYRDTDQTLRQTALELSRELLSARKRSPGKLTIAAHSMGARIVLAALWYLDHRAMDLGEVELTLIAPTLEGFAAANGARFMPSLLSGIPGMNPGVDMGSASTMQRLLAGLLPTPNVSTTIFVGGRDEIVDHKNERFLAIADNLEAPVIELPRADHDGIVGVVARHATQSSTRYDL